MNPFLGTHIHGDDFDAAAIHAWFADEREAYADLGARNRDRYEYQYHLMNQRLGFSRLPASRRFRHALGFGSAFGDELLPILDRIDRVTIVDPSNAFVGHDLGGKPAVWVKPDPTGRLAFPDMTFDLVSCFGVLHHIPNVSFVLKEIARVMKDGGVALIREPIVSMGDWSRPRAGLTRRERGLPLVPFQTAIHASGLRIVRASLLGFGPLLSILGFWRVNPYGSRVLTAMDCLLARVFAWNYTYHATTLLRRFRPTSVFLVITK